MTVIHNYIPVYIDIHICIPSVVNVNIIAVVVSSVSCVDIGITGIKISVVVDEKYLELGVRALHEAFELEKAA